MDFLDLKTTGKKLYVMSKYSGLFEKCGFHSINVTSDPYHTVSHFSNSPAKILMEIF